MRINNQLKHGLSQQIFQHRFYTLQITYIQKHLMMRKKINIDYAN